MTQVRKEVEAKGKDFLRELNDLTVSPVLRAALLKADPNLGKADGMRELLTKEFAQPTDISTAEFVRMTREVLARERRACRSPSWCWTKCRSMCATIWSAPAPSWRPRKRWASSSTRGCCWWAPARAP